MTVKTARGVTISPLTDAYGDTDMLAVTFGRAVASAAGAGG